MSEATILSVLSSLACLVLAGLFIVLFQPAVAGLRRGKLSIDVEVSRSKPELINRLEASGVRYIEVSNFGYSNWLEHRRVRAEKELNQYFPFAVMHNQKLDELQALRQEIVASIRSLRLLNAAACALIYCKEVVTGWPPIPSGLQKGGLESIWENGLRGEVLLTEKLIRDLGPGWTVLAGVKTRRGEIDRLAIGPAGVFAFEVKHYSGQIEVRGDGWLRYKTNRRGWFSGKVDWMKDGGGRSPSQQINQAADALQAMLRTESPNLRVYRAVILTHDRAKLIGCKEITVDWVGGLADFDARNMLAESGHSIPCGQLEALLRRIVG